MLWIVKTCERAYGEFARAPEPLDDADVIDGHCGEEKLSGVGIACLSQKHLLAYTRPHPIAVPCLHAIS